jgi:hypothetical protein
MFRGRSLNDILRALLLVGELLAVCVLLLIPPPAQAQTNLNFSGSSNCNAPDFEVQITFVNDPAGYYSLLIDNRNISGHSCVFDGPIYGPTVVPTRDPNKPMLTICYDCDAQPHTTVTLNPGQTARQTFRWKTTSTPQSGPCIQPEWLAGPILLVTPSLLKTVCTEIETSRFDFLKDSDPAGSSPRFTLTSGKPSYMKGENFSLRLALAKGAPPDPSAEKVCPTLYLRERSPDGATRMDELKPLAFGVCPTKIMGHVPGDWLSGFDIDSGSNSRWEGIGDHVFQIFQLQGSSEAPQLQFASSSILHIQIADPESISREWGTRVKGIAADVTLDKDTYRLGEDVPLHIAIENFEAEVPVYSMDIGGDPCEVVRIEVLDAVGHSVPPEARFPNMTVCTGHGWGPKPYSKGQIFTLERTLANEGWLPNHPGMYTVMVTWAPFQKPEKDPSSVISQPDFENYAVVSASATIQILSPDSK